MEYNVCHAPLESKILSETDIVGKVDFFSSLKFILK